MARPFVVMFVARSGSTALFGYLREYPDIVMRAEVFGNKALPDGSEQNDENRVRFVHQFWSGYAPTNSAPPATWRGFKWQIDWRDTQFSKPLNMMELIRQYQARVIVLRRENIVKQAISSLNARRLLQLTKATGVPSAHVKAADANVLEAIRSEKLHVAPDEISHLVKGIRRSKHRLNELALSAPDRLEISYEDLLKDPKSLLSGICSYLGVDFSRLSLDRPYLKITSDSLRDAVQNYDEVRQVFSGTEFEWMVAE